ncbi:MAG TPA: SpoIIE family protein phosphatase [Candidatus Sulfotelmatobacter sp.]|jgi:serine phosphatase RsbU (regulator of sigma subunit)/catechol 2,3-dioxygenase-like lactoylglutathione lyase family enzyme
MTDSAVPFGIDRHLLRLDQDPYLTLHFVIIYVRDQERALRFYADKLGFRVAVDHTFENGQRWIEVTPPDGTANLGLALIQPDDDAGKLVRPEARVWFVTEDVNRKYEEWKARGVKFEHPPEVPAWGGIHTRFEDPDGNSFGLAGFDELTSTIEAQRRVLAKKHEAERRSAQEMEIAKQVQARLFPQIYPEAKTLEYAGVCLQARQVGGDYFDFLDLGRRQLGLVVGDVSGKGIAAALLMANLQANLRSQGALAVANPVGFLRSVNRLFYANSADSSFASLFFAMYDDDSRRLRYANCGHLAGLILRRDESCERLSSTGTLLGLFQDWDCSIGECQLNPGDMLALYTDGVTEAHKDTGEEFGEGGLITALHEHGSSCCQAALERITSAVRDFNPVHQHDDITLIIAKCR